MTPFFKSEENPINQNGPVKKVVRNTFEDLVYDQELVALNLIKSGSQKATDFSPIFAKIAS